MDNFYFFREQTHVLLQNMHSLVYKEGIHHTSGEDCGSSGSLTHWCHLVAGHASQVGAHIVLLSSVGKYKHILFLE